VPSVLVCAEDVTAAKPDPAGYRRAAQALGLGAADCLVLEDSAAGVAAGRAAGAAVLGVSERALRTDAEVVVRDLRGLRWDGARLVVPDDALLRG
jgi:sugar-phosphatase